MSNDQKHKRPKFSLEFKQDAAQLVLEKGYSHQHAADTWVSHCASRLYRWLSGGVNHRQVCFITRIAVANMPAENTVNIWRS